MGFKYLLGEGMLWFWLVDLDFEMIFVCVDLQFFGLYVLEVVLGVIMYEGELVIFEEDWFEILLFLEYCFIMGKFFLEVIKIRNLGMLIDLKV